MNANLLCCAYILVRGRKQIGRWNPLKFDLLPSLIITVVYFLINKWTYQNYNLCIFIIYYLYRYISAKSILMIFWITHNTWFFYDIIIYYIMMIVKKPAPTIYAWCVLTRDIRFGISRTYNLLQMIKTWWSFTVTLYNITIYI